VRIVIGPHSLGTTGLNQVATALGKRDQLSLVHQEKGGCTARSWNTPIKEDCDKSASIGVLVGGLRPLSVCLLP
jgi:hypothetical protein